MFSKIFKFFKTLLLSKPFVPKDLDGAVECVSSMMGFSDAVAKASTADEFCCMWHHSIGRHIRNEFGLWMQSELLEWFIERGITHPDDMSSMILKKAYCDHYGYPFDFNKERDIFRTYWDEALYGNTNTEKN